jgi:hypothetical protein
LRCGFLWLRNQAVSTEYEQISLDTFIGILKTELPGANGGTIECVVLNACETEDMGKKLRGAGVSHVVCWRSEVQDDTAREFAVEFYSSLNEQDQARPRDYRRAFQHATARIGSGGGAARAKAKHLAVGAVDYVCLLSESGDECPDTGHIWQGHESDSGSQQFGPPRDKEDLRHQERVRLLRHQERELQGNVQQLTQENARPTQQLQRQERQRIAPPNGDGGQWWKLSQLTVLLTVLVIFVGIRLLLHFRHKEGDKARCRDCYCSILRGIVMRIRAHTLTRADCAHKHKHTGVAGDGRGRRECQDLLGTK